MKQLSSYSAHSNSSRTHALPSSTHSYAPYITMLVVCLTMSINSLWGDTYDFSAGTTIYYDFRGVSISDSKYGVNWWKGGDEVAFFTKIGSYAVVAYTFPDAKTATVGSTVFAKTQQGSYSNITFSAPSTGQNVAKINSEGTGFTWETGTARTFNSGDVIYFKDTWKDEGNDNNWVPSDGTLYACFSNDRSSWTTWSSCEGSPTEGTSWRDKNGVYSFTVPGSDQTYTFVKFGRGKDSGSNIYNETLPQSPLEGHDMFLVGNAKYGDAYLGAWCSAVTLEGTNNSWNVRANPFKNGELELDLDAHSTYEFKIYWTATGAQYGTASNSAITSADVDEWTLATDNSNAILTTAAGGKYTFQFDWATKKLSVTYPSVTHPSMDYTYMTDYGWGTHVVYLKNSKNSRRVNEIPGQPLYSTKEFHSASEGEDVDVFYFAPGDYAKFECSKNDGYDATGNVDAVLGKYLYNESSEWKWGVFSFTIELNHHGATTYPDDPTVQFNGTTPSSITVPTKANYRFDGYFTDAEGGDRIIKPDGTWETNVDGYLKSGKWIHEGGEAALHAQWTFRHTIVFKKEGTTIATIQRAEDEALNSNPTGTVAMPNDPDDDTLDDCDQNVFAGWSETDIDGDALTNAPEDLFAHSGAGDVFVNEDKIYYAVFAEGTVGMAHKRDTMWSENWDEATTAAGASDAAKPSAQSTSRTGRVVYGDATITYSESSNATYVRNGNYAGGTAPELLIKSDGGTWTVTGIPRGMAKNLTLTFTQNNTIQIDISGTGYTLTPVTSTTPGNIGDTWLKYTTNGAKEITINCGSDATFSLTFTATTKTGNVSLDDIAVRVKNDCATNYRTICPVMTVYAYPVTASTPFFITSTANRTVRSQDSIRIVGSHLTKSGAVSISSPASNFVLKSRTNGAITTNADGTIDTYAYIYYTPDAADTEDGLDKNSNFTISVAGGGSIDKVVNQELIGRHLPANFVIAAKKDGKWWALPADRTNSEDGTPTPVEIVVDNNTSPTKVLTPDANVYTLYGQHTNSVNKGDGQYVKLAMHGQSNAPLFGSTGTSLGKSSATNIENDQTKGYWWLFEQTNSSVSNTIDVKYFMRSGNNSNPVRIYSAKKGDQWQLNESGEGEIRLIPWYAEELVAVPQHWSQYANLVEVDVVSVSATKVKATLGANTTELQMIPSEIETDTYLLDFSGTGIDFAGKNGQLLTLDWYDSEESQVAASFISIPSIIAAGATSNWSSLASSPTIDDIFVISQPFTVNAEDAQVKEIIIDKSGSNTGQLEIADGQALVVKETVLTLNNTYFVSTSENDIVIGSTLANGTGALILGSHDGTNKATVNFAVKAKRKQVEDKKQWINQFIGTPFNDETAVLYNYYETQLYAYKADKSGSAGGGWWTKLSGSDGMTPFLGYNLMRSKEDDHVLWMQGTLVGSSDVTLSTANGKLYYNASSDTENLLANSWIAPIHIGAFEDDDFTDVEKTIYIFNAGTPEEQGSHSTADGSASNNTAGQYIVLPINSAEWTNPIIKVIPAMQAFSVFATGSDASLTLDYSKLVLDPALDSIAASKGIGVVPTRAPKRTLEEAPEVIKLRIAAESGYAAQAYILGREDFSAGFDDGWDGRFMEGDEAAPQLYAPGVDGKMVISCVPDIEGTVLNFRKGTKDAAYTVSFDYNGEENWYLNDQKMNEATLIDKNNTYFFNAADTDNEARFVISKTPIAHTPTSIDDIPIDRVRKILINDHIYIVRAGRMYDITGKRVQTIK